MAERLSTLAAAGTRVYFMCGNRDFLVGDAFCASAGMTRLEEPQRLECRGEDILLLHGDTLCTDDVSYQRFRRKVRDPAWQRRVLSKPAWLRRLLARFARLMSRRHTGSSETRIMDVNAEAVAETFRSGSVRRMIHGHTHRPAVHDLSVDQRHCQRIVLGDWHRQGSLVKFEDGQLSMLTISRAADERVELLLQETAAPLAGDT